MATDLDQRLLPNVLTLPVIPIALIYARRAAAIRSSGRSSCPRSSSRRSVPLVLYLLSIPFGAGAFGIGDAKLLVGVGLMTGGDPGVHRAWSSGARRGRRRARGPARRCGG